MRINLLKLVTEQWIWTTNISISFYTCAAARGAIFCAVTSQIRTPQGAEHCDDVGMGQSWGTKTRENDDWMGI